MSKRVEAVEYLNELIEAHDAGKCSCDVDGDFETESMCLGMQVIGGSVSEEDAIEDLMESF